MRRQRVPIYQTVIYAAGEMVCYIVGGSGGVHDLFFIGGRRDSDSRKWKDQLPTAAVDVTGC